MTLCETGIVQNFGDLYEILKSFFSINQNTLITIKCNYCAHPGGNRH